MRDRVECYWNARSDLVECVVHRGWIGRMVDRLLG